jgi:hypothetical protein
MNRNEEVACICLLLLKDQKKAVSLVFNCAD